MLVINHLGLRPAYQNSKLLLMSQYTTVTHILIFKYNIVKDNQNNHHIYLFS